MHAQAFYFYKHEYTRSLIYSQNMRNKSLGSHCVEVFPLTKSVFSNDHNTCDGVVVKRSLEVLPSTFYRGKVRGRIKETACARFAAELRTTAKAVFLLIDEDGSTMCQPCSLE